MIRLRSPRRLAIAGILGLAAIASTLSFAPTAGSSTNTGTNGIDTGLPATDSQLTLSGRGAFSDLKITVNQTKNLQGQAVSLTWAGATPTRQGPGTFGANYLQVMQCWGDDDGTNPVNPGPPPEQCVQGARNAIYGGATGLVFPPGSLATERILSRNDWPNYDPSLGAEDDRTHYVWLPFKSVDGVEVGVAKDSSFNPEAEGGEFWKNGKYDINSTNEIAAARTGPDGKGSELVELKTGIEMKALGCGQNVQPVAGGGTKQTKCWLVVVPRGEPAAENAGTPYAEEANTWGVMTSPIAPVAWQNRIAFPLEFTPVESSCSLASTQRLINGSELAVGAIARWQPKLCAREGANPFAYGPVSDAAARQQLARPAAGAPGLVVVSRPLDQSVLDPDSPAVYAPLTLSGVVIGVNMERAPKPDADAAAQAISGTRVARLNLTPRLVAKLLTQSYRSQVDIKGGASPYEWSKANPLHLGVDPDFLQFNPEFNELEIRSAKNFGGLMLPAGNSDSARAVWEYVLADPEARAWLDGTPDSFGMKVNPVFATKESANSTGHAFADPVPSNFPKDDPYCYEGEKTGVRGDLTPPLLCGADWLPYKLNFREDAQAARAGDDGAKTIVNPFAFSTDKVYQRDVPQIVGSRVMMALTDSVSAYRYGLQTARLSRAGDNGATRTFVAPDAAGFAAGLAGMKAKDEPTVLEPDPLAAAPGGYPLSTLTYAAIKPLSLEQGVRDEYANFVEYASADGQVPGFAPGSLPSGYAPLPDALKNQTGAAAKAIRTLAASAAETTESGVLPASNNSSNVVGGNIFSPSNNSVFSLRSPNASPVDAAFASTEKPVQVTRVRNAGVTPSVAVSFTRFTLPILLVLAVFSAAGAFEVSRRPRRSAGASSNA